MAFGNDSPGNIAVRAVLTVFSGAVQVGQTFVLFNDNDLVDQTIAIGGVGAFDRATLLYTQSDGTPSTLAILIDDVSYDTHVTVVPLPASLPMLAMAVSGLVGWRRRRP